MKKTQSISLASTLFWMEEDAYQALDRYLSGIKTHFAQNGEGSEIVKDIEARIAEQFLESKKKIITLEEVEKVIASMGDVGDFGDEKKSEDAEPEYRTGKRLYRNSEDKVIAGVASGIAAYLGVDPLWVRIAFILLAFLNGFGILLYLVLGIFIPEAKTASQLLEMRGTPVTLETLSDRTKGRLHEINTPKNRGVVRRILTLPFKIIGQIFRFTFTKIFPIIGRIFGACLSVCAALALLGFSVLFGLVLTHSGGEYFTDFPINELFSAGMVVLASSVAYLAIAIPFYFLLFLGISLLTRRRIMNSTITFALLGVWFLSVVVGIVMGISAATSIVSYRETSPTYQDAERVVELTEPFTEIDARSGLHVVYVQNAEVATTTVTFIGRAKVLDTVTPAVQDGILSFSVNPIQKPDVCIFCDFYGTPKVLVTAPSVATFVGAGGARISAEGVVSAPAISISLSGGASGSFTLGTAKLIATVRNGGYLNLSGKADQADFTAENGSQISAFDLSSVQVTVNAQNAASVDVGNAETLDVKARTSADIRYMGNPILTQDLKSAAQVMPYDW